MEKALQEKRQIIIRATGEAKAAEYFGKSMQESPAYIDLKRIEAAREISKMLG